MNGKKEEKFAQLLTEAIYAIKRCEGKQIGIIQDELMYAIGREGGNPIEYWRKGNTPTDQAEFVKLSCCLVERGRLGREWLTSFWECTEFTGLQETATKTFSGRPEMDFHSKNYISLIGREKQIADIINCLRNPKGHSIVAIDGMGGIGKTALAHEVALRCVATKTFDAVYWITDDIPIDLQETPEHVSLEMIYNKLGRHLGHREFSSLSFAEKFKRLKTSLSSGKNLIVVDNLERAIDTQEKAVYSLHEILGKHSKVLLLSRYRFSKDVYHIHLQGLVGKNSINFLRHEFDTRGIERHKEVGDEVFKNLVEMSGGSPLAMKLIVGQLGYQDLDLVVNRLQNIQIVNKSSVDEYTRFYKYIFEDSWKLLGLDGKKLLVSMSHFTSGHGGAFEAICATCGLPSDIVASNIDELWKFAFLEVGNSTVNKTRYYLHALTHNFVHSALSDHC